MSNLPLTDELCEQVVIGTLLNYPKEWAENADLLSSELFRAYKCQIVSDLLQRIATDDEREKKIDIGDWLIEALKTRASEKGMDTDKAKPP